MNLFVSALSSLPLLAGSALVGHAQAVTEIGGQKVVTLTRAAVSTTKPEFNQHHPCSRPRHGDSPDHRQLSRQGQCRCAGLADLAEVKKMLDTEDTGFGDLGYRLGAAFLVPYPNRIRGKLSADGKMLDHRVGGPHFDPSSQQCRPSAYG